MSVLSHSPGGLWSMVDLSWSRSLPAQSAAHLFLGWGSGLGKAAAAFAVEPACSCHRTRTLDLMQRKASLGVLLTHWRP